MKDVPLETMARIRPYQPGDLESCRALWVELTEWHRHIYQSPAIGGDEPGLQFDEHLDRVGAEHLWVAEVDGRVVGLAGLIPGDRAAELEPVVVSALHRRQERAAAGESGHGSGAHTRRGATDRTARRP
jgi:hypothetical protein